MKRLLVILAILLIPATIYKAARNHIALSKPNAEAISFSSREAKLMRVFEAQLQPDHLTLAAGGEKIPLKEAWIEQRSDHAFFLVWFPIRKQKPGYRVVLRAQKGTPVPLNFLALPGSGAGFLTRRTGDKLVFSETFPALPPDPLTLDFRTNWSDPPSQTLTLRRK